MKKATLILSLMTVFLMTACSAAVPVSNPREPSTVATESAVSAAPTPSETETAPETSSTPTETATAETNVPSTEDDKNIVQETKDYLLNGQNDLPEAGKLQWTEAFLNLVDIDAVYQEYLASGGHADDIKSFAEYLTENAPVPENWKELFETSLLEQYDVEVARYEDLGDGYYQAYVIIDGNEVPYVAVNSRTGYFHG